MVYQLTSRRSRIPEFAVLDVSNLTKHWVAATHLNANSRRSVHVDHRCGGISAFPSIMRLGGLQTLTTGINIMAGLWGPVSTFLNDKKCPFQSTIEASFVVVPG